MGRTMLSPRTIETIDMHIGHVLIFCEGSTEKNYFDFFKEKIKDRFADIVIETEKVGSNARAVLNYAEKFLSFDGNESKYSTYEKYLVFDCDAPDDILDVIKEAKTSDKGYVLLLSSLLFECWLLMHLEILTEKALGKVEIGHKLENHLDLDDYEKHKDDKGIIAKIIKDQGNLENAIQNANFLKITYDEKGKTIEDIISEKLPYSVVNCLVEQLAKAASL